MTLKKGDFYTTLNVTRGYSQIYIIKCARFDGVILVSKLGDERFTYYLLLLVQELIILGNDSRDIIKHVSLSKKMCRG